MLTVETYLAQQLGVRVFSVQCGMIDGPVVAQSLVYVQNEKAAQDLISDLDDVYGVIDVRAIHSTPQSVRETYPLATWVHWATDHFGADHTSNPHFLKYDIIVTVSHIEGGLWRQHIPEPRIRPIYNPVDYDSLHHVASHHKRQQFKLVAPSARASIDQLRSIMVELLKKDGRFELFVLSPRSPSTSNTTDEQLNIRFLGTVPHEDMLVHMATSLAVLHPSNVPETFASCLLEPASMGVFVAAMDAPASAAKEILECCGVGNWTLPPQFNVTVWAELVYGWSQQLPTVREAVRLARRCEAADSNHVLTTWKRMLRLPCRHNDPDCQLRDTLLLKPAIANTTHTTQH